MGQLKAPFSITPKPRFFNLSLGVNNLSLFNSAKFTFPEDAVLRYMTIVTSSSTNGVASVFMAVAFNAPDILGSTAIPNEGVIYADSFATTLAVGANEMNSSKSTSIHTQDMFTKANETILTRIVGTGTFTGFIDISIAFNPIAEWVNFREPTIGARI